MTTQKKAKKPTVIELTDALQRERADAENLRRRYEEQMSGLKTHVKANVVRDLLPIIDNCERLLEHVSSVSEAKPWKEGVGQIVKQMQKTLADMGVERIKTVGEVFDPHLHEAISVEDPSTGSGQAVEIVSEELQPGYKLGDQVIRHAMVRVKMEKK
jgi:molecular chaperone GrpE